MPTIDKSNTRFAVDAAVTPLSAAQVYVTLTGFLALFSIVGVALYRLPFFYDFMVRDFGWTRREVTSGNAYSKLLVGPLFGFLAGWMVDRFGPRSEEHTSELQSRRDLVCRLLLEKKKTSK